MTEPTHNADDWPRIAAERATIGLAVVRAGETVWRNTAFDAAAKCAGRPAAALAVEAAASDRSVEIGSPAGQRLRLTARRDDALAVITVEVVSHGRSPSVGSDVEDRDATTGALNRHALERAIARWFDRRDTAPFALLFLDLDDFKAVNDADGHLAGDACLRAFADRLRRAVRAGDIVGRFGGDEFVVLAAGVSEQAELRPLVTRLRAAGGQAESGRALGVSVGAALSVEGHATPRDLIQAADRAMYRAKRGEGA